MSKQSKSSVSASKTSKKDVKKTVTLNLAHLIFLHGVLRSFPRHDIKEENMKRFVSDLIFLFEIYIDGVEDDELKEKLNYKPLEN